MGERFTESEAPVSWGRVVRATHQLAQPRDRQGAAASLKEARDWGLCALAFGLGRSYGDSNLNPDGALIATRGLDRFIRFDRQNGVLHAEAGVSLDDILRVTTPSGFFLPTTPGSRQVTLGGAVANDVHGKNHHRAGSFGRHVKRLTLARSDGSITQVTPEETPDLFAATVGGLGLTGVILDVEIALTPIPSTFINQTIEPLESVDHFFDIAEARAERHEHTVAWIDCTAAGDRLGQGVFSSGDWAEVGGLEPHDAGAGPTLPFDAPRAALNPLTLKLFNSVYRRRQLMKPQRSRVHYSGFFHPLDSIRDWNRLYGSAGFYQYQSVIGFDAARDATRAMLERISASGEGSFLAVLKTFGELASPGILSFPAPGATLALDFANRGDQTLRLLADLDAVVREAGGRLYPAKDGRMSATMFQAGYPGWERAEALRDPAISSAFWRRVTQ